MIISGKYELTQALSGTGFQSFHARQLVTGRNVMVHFLRGRIAENRPALKQLEQLTPEKLSQLLDADEYEGTMYLVTAPLTNFTNLETWLSVGSEDGIAPVPPAATPVPDTSPRTPGTGTSGEFTRLFKLPDTVVPAPPRLDSAPLASFGQSGVGAGTGAGEFTRFFQLPEDTPDQPPHMPPPPPPPAAAAPRVNPQLVDSSGGEFTQLFRGPAAPAPVPPAPPAGPPAGEFTQLFRGPVPELDLPPAPPVAPPPPFPAANIAKVNPRLVDSGGGEFTQLFRDPAAGRPAGTLHTPPNQAASPYAGRAPMEGATELFRPPLAAPGSSPAGAVPPPLHGGSIPSEFTMILGGTAGGHQHQQAPPSPPPALAAPASFSLPAAPQLPGSFSPPSLPQPPAMPQMPVVVKAASGMRPAAGMLAVACLSCVVTLGVIAILYLMFR